MKKNFKRARLGLDASPLARAFRSSPAIRRPRPQTARRARRWRRRSRSAASRRRGPRAKRRAARARRATAGGVRGSARPRLAHAPWHSPTPPPRASTRARSRDRGEALGDDDDALAERFVDATRGRTRRANAAGGDANAFVAHDEDHDIDPRFTEDLLLSSRLQKIAARRGKNPSGKNARVFKNASLAKYCTLGLGGNARVVVEVYTIEQFVSTLRLCASLDAPFVVVGKGSNVLFADAGFDGVAIQPRGARGGGTRERRLLFHCKTDDDDTSRSASNKKETRLFRVGSGRRSTLRSSREGAGAGSSSRRAFPEPRAARRSERGRGRTRHRQCFI